MPYTRKVLIFKGTRVKPAGIPATVGEHVLKKRLEDGLDRKQLATRFGVDECTLMNWELGRTKTIPARAMPGIINYLGYNPEPEPAHFGARLQWKRRSMGWTAAEAARQNSVDQSTWEVWEKRKDWPRYPRYRAFLQEFLSMPDSHLAHRIREVESSKERGFRGVPRYR